jgi:hypothetical protein
MSDDHPLTSGPSNALPHWLATVKRATTIRLHRAFLQISVFKLFPLIRTQKSKRRLVDEEGAIRKAKSEQNRTEQNKVYDL